MQLEKDRHRKLVLIRDRTRFVQQKKAEMKSETQESRKADNFTLGLQSERWAALKRTWETQDWLRH